MAEGLPSFGGAQRGMDTIPPSALQCDGFAIPRAANNDVAALVVANRLIVRGVCRSCWHQEQSKTGVVGWRGCRTMVSRDFHILQVARINQTSVGGRTAEAPKRTSVGTRSCPAAHVFAASLLEVMFVVG